MNFSIVTPSLNYGRFLRDCMQSVAEQEGVLLEHLVMDGGSNDESAGIAGDYANATWLQESDRGMSDAINKGFDRARGEWVMWLNADDRLRPGVLAKLLPHLSRTDADVFYGNFNFIDLKGDFIRTVKSPKWSTFVNTHHHCFIGSTAAFYRRKTIIDKGHRLRTDFHCVMDGEFYARLDMAGKKFKHVSITVADFRMHGQNVSQRYLGKTESMDQILAAESQHVESRAIRRAYGITLFSDPYLNGLIDGMLWIVARVWKFVLKCMS